MSEAVEKKLGTGR